MLCITASPVYRWLENTKNKRRSWREKNCLKQDFSQERWCMPVVPAILERLRLGNHLSPRV